MIYHIIPIDDLKEHEATTDCHCQPLLKVIDAKGNIICRHSAYDGREAIEEVNEILNQTKSYE